MTDRDRTRVRPVVERTDSRIQRSPSPSSAVPDGDRFVPSRTDPHERAVPRPIERCLTPIRRDRRTRGSVRANLGVEIIDVKPVGHLVGTDAVGRPLEERTDRRRAPRDRPRSPTAPERRLRRLGNPADRHERFRHPERTRTVTQHCPRSAPSLLGLRREASGQHSGGRARDSVREAVMCARPEPRVAESRSASSPAGPVPTRVAPIGRVERASKSSVRSALGPPRPPTRSRRLGSATTTTRPTVVAHRSLVHRTGRRLVERLAPIARPRNPTVDRNVERRKNGGA